MKYNYIAIVLLAFISLAIVFIVREQKSRETIRRLVANERLLTQRILGNNPSANNTTDIPSETAPKMLAPTKEITAYEEALDHWMGNVDKLKDHLKRSPDLNIPEMTLLTLEDWLDVAKEAVVNDELDARFYLSRLRQEAKSKFGRVMKLALIEFTQRSGNVLPRDISELAPFIQEKSLTNGLARYQVVEQGPVGDIQAPRTAIAEKAVVDAYFDTLLTLKTDGTTLVASSGGANEIVHDASIRYYKANGRYASSILDIVPYFREPVDPVLIAKLDEIAKRSRNTVKKR